MAISMGYYTRRSLIQADVVERLRALDCRIAYKGGSDHLILHQIASVVGHDFVFRIHTVECSGDESYRLATKLSGLINLSISDCPELEDLSAISHMQSLEQLHVEECPNLRRLNDCRKLRNLKVLQLYLFDSEGNSSSFSGLNDFTWMRDLRNLEAIYIFGDISELPKFHKLAPLETVEISHFEGDNLDAFEDISSLATLNFWNCPKLSDIRGIQNCKRLKVIKLRGITTHMDASELGSFKDLTKVFLTNSIVRFDGTPSFGTSLNNFAAPAADLRNLDFLQNCKSLKRLVINAENLSNIDMLANLKGITELHVRNSSCKLDAINQLPKLKFVYLENCDLSQIENTALNAAPLLEGLSIQNSECDKLSLDLPTTLTSLDIIGTGISSLDPASIPMGLRYLYIDRNQLDQTTIRSIRNRCPSIDIVFPDDEWRQKVSDLLKD